MFHRTSSLDLGIVLEGAIEMILDDNATTLLQRGDMAVQRATRHAWRNPSATEWTRMMFVLQDIRPLRLGEEVVGEDLGVGVAGLPASGNDGGEI